MAYAKMDCPACGERVLVDGREGKGFCMYCGEPLDTGEAISATSGLGEVIDLFLDEEQPGEAYPWYNKMIQAATVLNDEGYEAAMEPFASLYRDDMDEDERDELYVCIRQEIVMWIVDSYNSYGTAYRGGAMDLVECIGPWFSDAGLEIIMMSLEALRNRVTSMMEFEDAATVIIGLYHTMYDLITISRDPAIIAGMNEILGGIQLLAAEMLEEYITDDQPLFDEEYMVNVIGETVIACDMALEEFFGTGKELEDITQDDGAMDEAQDAMLSMLEGEATPEQAAGAAKRYFEQVFRTE